jgi:GTP-binding protein HflX
MTQYELTQPDQETAILVGIEFRSTGTREALEASLSELSMLSETAGIDIVGTVSQMVDRIDPATFVGKGKVEEIIASTDMSGATVVIFDDELSPRHQRELERRMPENVKVLDRSALILDIFAQHARTREGALQVELAQYEYRLPRLTRQWTHLARQAGGGAARGGSGGVGLRGPGETQLEVDRREIGRKITKLKSELENVRQHRSQHRNQRKKSGIPVIALAGYTNAGKSTLLNAIADADVYVADQLFATLDPTTRRVTLPSGQQVLFTDTVGFIQKLPTTLVAAFRATLEEITEADILLHVVDVSHPNVDAHIEAVEDTLAEIEMPDIPRILVWNKEDRWHRSQPPLIQTIDVYEEQVLLSAARKTGLNSLLNSVEKVVRQQFCDMKLLIPYQRGDVVSQLFSVGQVYNQEHIGDGVIVNVRLPIYLYEQYRQYELIDED